MMISPQMKKKLLEQVVHEWESEYLYYAMMAWCHNHDYNGFAHWFRKQAEEEHSHGLKILDYLLEVGAEIELPATLTVQPVNFKEIEEVFAATLAHEQKVTRLIHDLADLAVSEKDHATLNYLQWFISEQLEEESGVRDIIGKLKRVKAAPGGLYMLENHLAQRA